MNPFYIGGIIGFGPALFLIWFSLRKYTYPYVEGSLFEDRRVFFLLAVGMVLGTFLFTFEQYLAPLYTFDGSIDLLMFMLIFVIAFPLMEDLAKYMVLNFKGYEGRFDSTFYGISLGAGYSATMIIGYVFIMSNRAKSEGVQIAPEIWLGIVLFSVCSAFLHCTVGATLGSATGRKMGLRGLPGAVVPHFIFNLLLFPWFVYDQIWYSLIILLPVSAMMFHGAYAHTIPECLPPEVQKETRRAHRRKTQ
jgi:RsiW-degrading membrane proteinase PrsW (M82 family)